jgi:hypothetical protein
MLEGHLVHNSHTLCRGALLVKFNLAAGFWSNRDDKCALSLAQSRIVCAHIEPEQIVRYAEERVTFRNGPMARIVKR